MQKCVAVVVRGPRSPRTRVSALITPRREPQAAGVTGSHFRWTHLAEDSRWEMLTSRFQSDWGSLAACVLRATMAAPGGGPAGFPGDGSVTTFSEI